MTDTPPITKRLPRNTNKLLRIVRRCLRQCLKDPQYNVYQRLYHTRLHNREGEPTQVCLSGCVIAKFFKFPADQSWSPYDFDKRNRNILLAIDQIEQGNYKQFFDMLKKDRPVNIPKQKLPVSYGYDKFTTLRKRLKWLIQKTSVSE